MKLNNRYIGCNFTGTAVIGGIDSSFNGLFTNEEVLIEGGLCDYVPCMLGNIDEAYIILKEKIKNNNVSTFKDICACIYETVDEYFGGIKNIKTRMNYYNTLDDIMAEEDIGKVSTLKGKGAAMCVERAMLSQNLLKSLGINSFYKTSAIMNNEKKEIHAYNLVEYNNTFYIFDTSIPSLMDNKINPLITTIPKEVFDNISNKSQKIGYSVTVSHFNPIRNKDVKITYDYGRKDIYYADIEQKRSK